MITITGELAKQIYEQILKDDKAMNISNVGTEAEPLLRLRGC